MEHAAVFRRLASWVCVGSLAGLLGGCTTTDRGLVGGDTRNQVIISVRDQKLTVVQPDHHRVTFPISTSKYGFGDRRGSYATPLGELEVAQKIGGGAPAGSVFRSRVRTGEIVGIDAPGRDAIVTRILALRGLESGNRDAYARGIYIHGTPEERNIGRPVSYGCIRMRSRDVIALYDMVRVGAKVQIIDTTMNKALASNIVTPPPVTTPMAPAADIAVATTASGTTTAITTVKAPGATATTTMTATVQPDPRLAKADPATSKALTKAMAVQKSNPGTTTPPLGVVTSSSTNAVHTVKPVPPAKKEWAGSPSRLLKSAEQSEARNRNTKSSEANGTPPQAQTSYDDGSHRSLSRAALDSL